MVWMTQVHLACGLSLLLADQYNIGIGAHMKWDHKVLMNRGAMCVAHTLSESWCLLVLFRHAECMECNLSVHDELHVHLTMGSIYFGGR